MKKLLLILVMMMSLGVTTKVNAETNTNTTQCVNVFYQNTKYLYVYNVGDKYMGGVRYYARWYTVSVAFPVGALALNNFTCNFNTVNTNTYSYFVWVAY
jgi:hypothetical protein